MLPPNFLENLESQAINLYNNLELDIIEEIAERISNVGYANTVVKNDVMIAQEMGMLHRDIVSLVAKYNKSTYEEILSIFEEAGATSIKNDDDIYKLAGLNPIKLKQDRSMMNFLIASAQKTNGNLQNLVMTTANTSQTEFVNAMNTAYMEISTGVKNYSQSILDAINKISAKGTMVEYPSGHRTSIENATRMNIVTGVNQTCGKLQQLRAEELNWDLMELTAHAGARPSHAEWQGKIVSLSGKKGYLSLKDIGYGEITGFKGINCYHDWRPYYEGAARTYTDKELKNMKEQSVTYNNKKITKYDASQIQRDMERQIRQDKKDIAGIKGILTSNNKDIDIASAQAKLKQLQNKYNMHTTELNDFISQTGLRKDNTRLIIGNLKNENVLKKSAKNDIIIRDKAQGGKRYEVKKGTIENIMKNELSSIKFPVQPIYNPRIQDNGKTIATLYKWGEVKEIKAIYIGKQDKDTKEFLMDTLIHEKLEAKILTTKTKKYAELNSMSDEKRHEYINSVIKRYFKMKGWNYENT